MTVPVKTFLPELSVAEIIGEDKTFGCAVLWGATMIGNGVCELTSAPFDTSKSTSNIVTNGVLRFSRNPLYLSLVLLLSGVAILLSAFWLFLAIPILYILFLFKAVKPEEKYLFQKFGEEYLYYSKKVRRWI